MTKIGHFRTSVELFDDMVNPFIKEEAIEEDKFKETSNGDH